MQYDFMLGYDYAFYQTRGIRLPLSAPLGHLIVVGGSGSGKSTALLYWLAKMKQANILLELHVMDFKASGEFVGITETEHYAQFEQCYQKICNFYGVFCGLPEGGDGFQRILLIDEIVGLLTYYSMQKAEKAKAEKIKSIMSSLLMLGRSRKCFLWLSMQRYSATIFPASSGAADNFHICVGLGRLTVDSRRSLFAGEHNADEEKLLFGQGNGIVLIDGKPLQTLLIPRVTKQKLLHILRD